MKSCPTCEGTGSCRLCHGEGELRRPYANCPLCTGAGRCLHCEDGVLLPWRLEGAQPV